MVVSLRILRSCNVSSVVKRLVSLPNGPTSHRNSLLLLSYRHASDRRYTDKHEWVSVNGKIGTIGISHYAQDNLGDIVYAQLPDEETEINQKDECGALESVKAASEIYSPVSGKVVEKNSEVETSPGLINQSCYEKGWLFKIDLSKPEELNSLMDESSYEKYLKESEH